MARTQQQVRMNAIRARRVGRVRARVAGTAERPRLAVHRTAKHVSAQIVDDATGKTLAAAHDRELADQKLTGVARAEALGTLIAERAKEKGVASVVFDRRGYRYHGRVRAIADAARAAGLSL